MGRPLKIKKIIETGGNGKDIGFNAFNQLTNPALPVGGAMNTDQYLGVVGGVQPPTVATAAYPIVKVSVNIALPNGTGQGQNDGLIIRQKGARKYLVASVAGVQDEDIVVGATYRIVTLDTTDWQQMGAPAGAQVGTIFTCTALCASPQNGVANLVGQCVLTSDLTPSDPGTMSISFFYGSTDSTEQAISKLTNKFLLDFTGGEPGGNANTGDVWNPAQVSQNVRYASNFFSDEGYEVKSGTSGAANTGTQQNRVDIAQVEKYTS